VRSRFRLAGLALTVLRSAGAFAPVNDPKLTVTAESGHFEADEEKLLRGQKAANRKQKGCPSPD
jgi:hypothetical protein